MKILTSLFMMVLSFGWTISYGQIKVVDGKVGVGISLPERLFHMRGQNAVFRIDRDRNSPGFIIARYKSNFVGNALSSYSFTVFGSNTGEKYFQISDLNGEVSGSGTRRLVIDNDGSLIIGTSTSSAWKLDVAGSAFKSDGLSNWNIMSDKRLKKNIKHYKDGLNIIYQLEPVSYEYNGKVGTIDGAKGIGVIAQDLQKVAPHMVSEFKLISSGDNVYRIFRWR